MGVGEIFLKCFCFVSKMFNFDTKQTKPMARENSKVWPRTVSEALLAAWQKLRRKGDPELMAATLGYSRPVIDRALIYGYSSFPELPDKINNFFMERLKKEETQAAELIAQADKVEKIKQ